ncbi:hypothetical protein CPLU01_01384 [Colletotrichum plurivorum]|uniref:Uncharacterized protein n=1 Tax=Colletotrichum plurivorum TaxID=2175906 RepID=A0A8H6NPE0_9PEZI|nr:hypothetical protein CPLU01_01384 [Colletotrichum plurivorum]
MGVGPLRCVTCILDVAKNCYILLPRELELRRPCRPPTEMNADAPGVGLGRGAVRSRSSSLCGYCGSIAVVVTAAAHRSTRTDKFGHCVERGGCCQTIIPNRTCQSSCFSTTTPQESKESGGGRDDSSFSSWADATMHPILLHTAASDELHERMDDLALREDSTSRRRRPAKRTDDQDTADTRPSPEINGRSSTWPEKTPQTVQSVPSATTLFVRQSPFRPPTSKFSKPNLGLREVTVSISESTVAPFVRRS